MYMYMRIYQKAFRLGFPHPTVKYVGEPLGRPYLIGIVGRCRLGGGDRGRDSATGPAVFGRCRNGGGALLVVMVLRFGPRQRRATASRVPASPVLLAILLLLLLQRVLFASSCSLFAATTDGRRAAVDLAVDRFPVPGQRRLVRLGFVPRRERVPVPMVMVVFAIRRRRSGHRARRGLDHGDLAGRPATTARLMRRLGATAAAIFVLVMMHVLVILMVMRRGHRGRRRIAGQRDLRQNRVRWH